MHFQHPEYFIGLVLIPLLVFLILQLNSWKKKLGIPHWRSYPGQSAGEIFFGSEISCLNLS